VYTPWYAQTNVFHFRRRNEIVPSHDRALPGGATLFGTQAKGAYECTGKTYLGRLTHASSFDTCVECHEAHTGAVNTQGCSNPFCHGTTNPRDIRYDTRDFAGDGSKAEGLYYQVAAMSNILYAAIQSHATNVAESPIVTVPHQATTHADRPGSAAGL
jgi:hypothetical protein